VWDRPRHHDAEDRKEQDTRMSDRPNIVLILNDDMGFSDIGCYGGEIQTPNLDAFASSGVRFTQFYNTARCCPSRASLLTGLHPHQAGVGHMMDDYTHDGYRGDLNDRCVTIAEVLRAAGYATYMSGKWHVTRFTEGPKHNWPCQRGFDRFFGTITGAGSYFDPNTLTEDSTPIETPEGDFYYTDAISDRAARFIREHPDDRPFFAYVAYTAPHWPLHALPEDMERYRGRFDRGWDVLREERLERMIDMGIIDPKWRLTDRDERVLPWDEAEHKAWEARRTEVYAAQVDRMDQGIGRIVDALRDTGRLDNTLILFLADNGGCAEEIAESWAPFIFSQVGRRHTRDGRPVHLGNDPAVMPGGEDTYQSCGVPWANVQNTPFRLYKHWVHEGGIATPLIAHWPARITARGELRHQPGQLPDLMATCLDVAGADYPAERDGKAIPPCEGFSLVPVFDDEPNGRELLVWEHEGNAAARKGRWKLVRKHPGDWELYDMEQDRTELNDLASEHPEVVAELSGLYEAWAERCKVQPWEDVLEEMRKKKGK
jgi:arylsulfatase